MEQLALYLGVWAAGVLLGALAGWSITRSVSRPVKRISVPLAPSLCSKSALATIVRRTLYYLPCDGKRIHGWHRGPWPPCAVTLWVGDGRPDRRSDPRLCPPCRDVRHGPDDNAFRDLQRFPHSCCTAAPAMAIALSAARRAGGCRLVAAADRPVAAEGHQPPAARRRGSPVRRSLPRPRRRPSPSATASPLALSNLTMRL